MSRDYNNLSGNKFSLRSTAINQIKKIDGLNTMLGSLSDVLVSTWAGIFKGLATLAIGIFLVVFVVRASGTALILKNMVPMILILLGSLLVALNAVLTNPSTGSQILGSIRFLKIKILKRNIGDKEQKINIFRINEEQPQIVEAKIKGKIYYLTVFSVRGAVSPVSFESELNALAEINSNLLSNLERDTAIIKINMVQKTSVKKKELPNNATPEMVFKRDKKYEIGKSLKKNQQLSSVVILSSRNFSSIISKTENVKLRFEQGLVVGYKQLEGKEAKKAIYKIYGTK